MYYQGLINKYREYLPVNEFTPIVTLNEGNTPLIKADNLARKLELDAEIYLKFEDYDNEIVSLKKNIEDRYINQKNEIRWISYS